MANEENLIPFNERSKSEAREMGAKGGKASGESRRGAKLLREYMSEILDLPVSDLRRYNKLARLGIAPENIDNRALLVSALFARAALDGDVGAFKEIRDLIGEDKTQPNDIEADPLSSALEGLAQELNNE